ncbi:hypothetical protein [Streptomyces hebeiensis]
MSKTRTGKTTRTRRPKPAATTTRPTPTPALPVRPVTPDFITVQQMTAAYTARLADLPHIPVTAWTPQPDGTLRAHLHDGTHLIHTPTGPTPFRALTPCPAGAHHDNPITTGHDLHGIQNLVATCTARHGRHRIHPLATAVRLAEDTQPLDSTDLSNDQPKEHPHP